MKAKVFISSGQHTEDEKAVAKNVAELLQSKGFDTYVAIQVHTIMDLNREIIGELKKSDYYLFINFRRDLLASENSHDIYRGSLYTNQELAIAYAFGFEKMIFLNQKRVERKGMFGVMASNTPEFENYDEVVSLVERAIAESNWDTKFSRQLVPLSLEWSPVIPFGDHTVWEGSPGRVKETRILIVSVKNTRPDIGASNATMRLLKIVRKDIHQEIHFGDKNPLKATGHINAFSQLIWPDSVGKFDLLAQENNSARIFLISAHDLSPRRPIIENGGLYHLEYEVFAEGFPITKFVIELTPNPVHQATARILNNE
ncbi:MAG: hypothetical protein V4507_04700 [Verrucomicrobiota bacterium]